MRLQSEIKRAVQQEDYSSAARLKTALDELEAADPILALQRQLAEAVAEERYKDAAALRAQLASAEAAPFSLEFLSTLPCSSDTVTHGIRVRVRSSYMPQSSSPAQGRYFFGYRVTITNESSKVVQLRSRHWVICDEAGEKEEVRGAGVVGAQPVLLPGKSFEYDSGCPLTCPTGCMEGTYSFVVLDEVDGRFKDSCEVAIGRFKLSVDAPPLR